MAWVYILQNKRDVYCIGSTIDIDRRPKQHRAGETPSVKRLGDMHLVFKQEYKTSIEARRIEYKLKKLKRKDYITKIIKAGYIRTTPG